MTQFLKISTPSIILFAMVLAGCGPLTSSPNKRPTPIPAPDAKETVWSALATMIDKGRIADTDKLILVVDRLRELDAITDAERARFDATFDGIAQKQRKTTPDDAKRLREMR